MPVGIPQFDPQGDASDAARIALAYGPGNSSDPSLTSMMQRASQLRMQKEQHDLQMQQAKLMQPVAEVKAKADLASAQSALASHVQMQKLREQAATAAPIANSEFIDASTLADWDQQSAALGQLQAKYSWMANVRDESGNQIYNGFLSAIDKARANAFMRGQIDARIAGVNEGIEKRGDTSKAVAEIRADGADKVSRYVQKRDAARAIGDTEQEDLYSNLLAKAQSSSISSAAGSEQIREKFEEAQANATDPNATPEEQQFWQGRMKFWQERTTALNRRGVKQNDPISKIMSLVGGGAAPAAGAPAASGQPSPAPTPAPAGSTSASADPFKGVNF